MGERTGQTDQSVQISNEEETRQPDLEAEEEARLLEDAVQDLKISFDVEILEEFAKGIRSNSSDLIEEAIYDRFESIIKEEIGKFVERDIVPLFADKNKAEEVDRILYAARKTKPAVKSKNVNELASLCGDYYEISIAELRSDLLAGKHIVESFLDYLRGRCNEEIRTEVELCLGAIADSKLDIEEVYDLKII